MSTKLERDLTLTLAIRTALQDAGCRPRYISLLQYGVAEQARVIDPGLDDPPQVVVVDRAGNVRPGVTLADVVREFASDPQVARACFLNDR